MPLLQLTYLNVITTLPQSYNDVYDVPVFKISRQSYFPRKPLMLLEKYRCISTDDT